MPADEIHELAADLSGMSAKLVRPARAALQAGGDVVARAWRANARETSGVHGKHYPKSIDSELQFSTNLSVEVGPNATKKQGRMGRGFEFGSINQPPHLDGAKAVEQMTPRVEELLTNAISGVVEAGSGGGSGLREYTTRAGVTRLATDAQIANWTRGSQ